MLTTSPPQIAFPGDDRRRKAPLTSFITHAAICVPEYVNTPDKDGNEEESANTFERCGQPEMGFCEDMAGRDVVEGWC